MNILEAIHNRRSIRSFKANPVPKKILEEILDRCRWSPSSSNTQPWEFLVLGGKVIQEVNARLVQKVKSEWNADLLAFNNVYPDIPYPEYPEPYRQRSRDLRTCIDKYQFSSGTPDLDEKRNAYLLYGGRFYGAPNAIIICTEKSICPKAIFDLGLVAQSIALAALAYELGTCLMSMPIAWPDILRDLLAIPESKLVALAIAIGYPEPAAKVNNFERTREPLKSSTRWFGI